MTAEFGLLGTVEARIDGRRVDLGHAKQRYVLAALLVDANHAVSPGELVTRLWGDRAPQQALASLYSYLSRLRQALAAADDISIDRWAGGYLLSVERSAVDLHRFRCLVARARAAGTPERAAGLFENALGLWHTETLSVPDTPWFNALRNSLAMERLAAELDLSDRQLLLGKHGELLPGLSARRRAHPLDERVAGQLMLALHRSGRTGEALEEYHVLRRQLAEELGTDPGADLQRLHQRILHAPPAPAATPAPAAATAARSAPVAPQGTAPGAAAAPEQAPAVPRQLPPIPEFFTGRDRELTTLDELLASNRGATAIAALGGAGGVGKTWLALRWAHRNRRRFPDGQLYANLRGFHPTAEPAGPSAVLRGFLTALGMAAEAVPPDPDAQAARYRSLTAGRHMLILLDNARDTAQVAPLLPGGRHGTVLVTSRNQLLGLATRHGARLLGVEVLTEPEGHELFARHLGAARIAAEPAATAELLAHCAGLPLAIGILAARAAALGTPLAELAEELREADGRLDALDTGDIGAHLRIVFAASLRVLRVEQARAFALLGLLPGPDTGLPAAAALLGLPPSQTRAVLRSLTTAHLIAEHAPGRFRMHALTRLYASERGAQLPAHVREPALLRLADHQLFSACRADRLLGGHPLPSDPGEPAPGSEPARPADAAEALAWFRAEHDVLRAALHAAQRSGRSAFARRLAWALHTYHAAQRATPRTTRHPTTVAAGGGPAVPGG
ncbi:AfsR/SARP family transcriptional regulator [Streptomyces hoynatensis]|uniref:SARP family transcriptional regulator n=1 Tax=Streptomyces hoynatensis TaxID=1141874 RepID=A0A3A9YM25_9ACTN|nr:AfsR/SARP family transcriptional regulator [Streptomyces hoynatensis]RKN35817.1 SARP family transcriptional regulator [Streptomyces hoynatensis]